MDSIKLILLDDTFAKANTLFSQNMYLEAIINLMRAKNLCDLEIKRDEEDKEHLKMNST
jgi:DTW domain-containing protein YfiP